MSRYDDLLVSGSGILSQIYPSPVPFANCPEAADAVDDYLNGEEIRSVSIYSSSGYNITAVWLESTLQNLIGVVQGLGRDHHVTVRGTRPTTSSLPPTHYFILANIGERVYVVDASTHEVNPDINEYYQRGEFSQLHYSVTYEAAGQFEG